MTTAILELMQEMSTFAMLGVIWVVQLVQYPGFQRVPASQFPEYHRHHCAAITPVVAPLMLIELGTSVALTASPGTLPPALQQTLLGCVLVAWCSTVAVQIPLHRRLAIRWDARDLTRLVYSNWIRTAAWSAKGALLVLHRLFD